MDHPDRRRYFRIVDRLRLRIVRRGPVDRDSPAPAIDEPDADDRRIAELLAALREQLPLVAELGELLNARLDRALGPEHAVAGTLPRADFRDARVTISACGLGLAVDEEYTGNERLRVEMMFAPQDDALAVNARVVRCEPRRRGGYLLHLEFAGLREEEQEMLIQTILRRQSAILGRRG